MILLNRISQYLYNGERRGGKASLSLGRCKVFSRCILSDPPVNSWLCRLNGASPQTDVLLNQLIRVLCFLWERYHGQADAERAGDWNCPLSCRYAGFIAIKC